MLLLFEFKSWSSTRIHHLVNHEIQFSCLNLPYFFLDFCFAAPISPSPNNHFPRIFLGPYSPLSDAILPIFNRLDPLVRRTRVRARMGLIQKLQLDCWFWWYSQCLLLRF